MSEHDNWTDSLIDRLNSLVRENRKYFEECSDGPSASLLIQKIHAQFNYIKYDRDWLVWRNEELKAILAEAALLIEKIGTTGTERTDVIQKAGEWLAKYESERVNLNK